ncbi:flippase [Mucilaginibacter glaciei]|uniref:Flippase n=1 Tax=Mucilaginibacter glaciei TaxID=2772109 RepID=A0A926NM55_9SPHI|nr:flippase [Mucilaginibacter glaciei]MBD1394649.1 flippase [Mucilaginibacter glaciei]
MSKSIKQLTKNLFSLTLVQIATYVLPLISVPIVSRIIGPEKYGTINFAVAYVAYFTLLISYSFDFSATRKISKDPDNAENRNKVFSEVFYTQCLLFVLSTITFVILLYMVTQLRENKTVVIFSYLLCVSTLFTQNWLFQAMQDLSKVALFNLISKVLFTVAILIVVRKNQDYIWQPLIISIVQAVIAIWSFSWAFKKYNIKLIKLPLSRCWEVLKEERIIFFSLVFVNLYSSTNTVILGLFQNATQVGYYTAAQRLIIIAQSVLAMPLAQAFYPFIGKAFGESREQGLRVAQKLIPLIIVFLGFATIAMFVLGPWVIRIFYGHRFEEAIPAFQILTIVPLLFSLNNVLGIQIMLNLGMDKYFFKITACAGVLSILLNFLIIKRYGYMGTTVNWLITEIFCFGSMYFVLYRQGLNPINVQYFKLSAMKEYLNPIKNKILRSKG